MDNHPLVKHISSLVNLTEEEATFLLSKTTERTYRKGQYIVQKGDVCTSTNFIIKGAVKKFYVDKTGKEHVVMLGIENWWASDLSSFITQQPADFDIECLEPTTIIRFSVNNYEQLVTGIPQMEKYFRKTVEQAYVATQNRLIQTWSLSAKERYVNFCQKYPEHTKRFPQYLIASYLGMSKEFLSKIRSQH